MALASGVRRIQPVDSECLFDGNLQKVPVEPETYIFYHHQSPTPCSPQTVSDARTYAEMAPSPPPEPEPGVKEEDNGVGAGSGSVTIDEEAGAGGENDMMSRKNGDGPDDVGNLVDRDAARTATEGEDTEAKQTPPIAQSEEEQQQQTSPGDTYANRGIDATISGTNSLESADAQHATTIVRGVDGEEEEGRALPFHTMNTEKQQRPDDTMDDSHGSAHFQPQEGKRVKDEAFASDGYGGEAENTMLGGRSEFSGRGGYQGYQADGGEDHGDGGTQGSGGVDNAEDDNFGTRGRRMFDGSRVAEPDNVQIVDAGDGADVIPGVDDLPIFANDQSKALNDEVKVR